MDETRTYRGFQLIEFNDMCDTKCSIQQSSIAIYEQPGTGAVWIGDNKNRAHLNEEMVKKTIDYLQNWLDTGELF